MVLFLGRDAAARVFRVANEHFPYSPNGVVTRSGHYEVVAVLQARDTTLMSREGTHKLAGIGAPYLGMRKWPKNKP